MANSNIQKGEIVLYQPNESIRLEVKLEEETVWLNIQQMAILFNREESNIRRHITNIFKDKELPEDNNVHFLHVNGVKKPVAFYNLDVIISVGYRVHSPQGITFRQWATSIIKQYLLKGYAFQEHFSSLQKQIEIRFNEQNERIQCIETIQSQQQQQLDFFIRTNTPPAEMVFFNGDFFTARVAIESIIKSARRRVIIIDAYVDAKTFDMMDVCASTVTSTIYTAHVGAGMIRLRDDHNKQVNTHNVEVFTWKNPSHDRWIIADDILYHCGHSLNATGNKISAITRMGCSPEMVLKAIY